MPRVHKDIKYKVKYVRRFNTKNGTATSFSISDKIIGSVPVQYQSYSFTVWSDIALKDDDYINIVSIDSVTTNAYKGKLYTNMSGLVKVVVNEERKFSEEVAPEIAKPQQEGTDEFTLPFDI